MSGRNQGNQAAASPTVGSLCRSCNDYVLFGLVLMLMPNVPPEMRVLRTTMDTGVYDVLSRRAWPLSVKPAREEER